MATYLPTAGRQSEESGQGHFYLLPFHSSFVWRNLEATSLLYYYSQVRIFKNTWFSRFAGKEGITDGELRRLVDRLEAGQADADLGGGVY